MNDWWSSLRHGGLLLNPQRVSDLSSITVDQLSHWTIERLRTLIQNTDQDVGAAPALISFVLEDMCGFKESTDSKWQRGNDVAASYACRGVTGESLKPRRIWIAQHGSVLPVFVDNQARIGVGRGRRIISKVHEWCRTQGVNIALVTNGKQFRLMYVSSDYDAWVEWDTAQWFEAGVLSLQIEGLQRILTPRNFLRENESLASPLVEAIQKSRQGQSQLSSILGERVRQAVEIIIHEHSPYLKQLDSVSREDIYRAATLIIMRIVVGLFAESRNLFPRDNQFYEVSYGLNGLWSKLQKISGGNAIKLRSRFTSWPQILSLFQLIYHGSHHSELTIRKYGGELFLSGDSNSSDPLRRAISVFESACFKGTPQIMSDGEVYRILERLMRCPVQVRQGRSAMTVSMPVDFRDLSTEYIGILYEGLLDYELRTSPDNDAIIFLNIGDQPALPLSRLESFEGPALKSLFKEFKKKKQLSVGSDESEQEEEEEEEEEENLDGENAEVGNLGEEQTDEEIEEAIGMDLRERAFSWARRAVISAGLVKAYTGRDPIKKRNSDDAIAKAATQLLARSPILPGDFYLVRWGGTRKGQGTFYTRPGLVQPTVRRTLAPLCYQISVTPTIVELRELSKPKLPEEILRLKIADISMGSASFLVSALRFVTDAVYRSLVHHKWVVEKEGTLSAGPGLSNGQPVWFREAIRDLPIDLDAAEITIRARLKRLVVERCIYGTDIDALAVELGRLALWLETMDRDLPFSFLDHKLKVGNSLVGCWFDRFQEFPTLCLHRPQDDAGDKKHETATTIKKGELSERLKEFRMEKMKPSLMSWLQSRTQPQLSFGEEQKTLEQIHSEAMALFEQLHSFPVHESDEKAQFFKGQVEKHPSIEALRLAFDTWCAVWFWPVELLEHFPLPHQFSTLSMECKQIVKTLQKKLKFFHWELEFPDVFAVAEGGFDAILGNPPWEVQKPNSKEWFSNIDPLYRTYGKQEALLKQRQMFADEPQIEHDWMEYLSGFKALSNWCGNSGYPWDDPDERKQKISFGGKKNIELHAMWRRRRKDHISFSDTGHPFIHQGSADLNSYKLFLEEMYVLLNTHGRLGVVVPSNVYTDKGSTDLRKLFLDKSRWEWLFSFENREKIFDIHRSFKFCPIILEKGAATQSIRTAFMRRRLADWDEAERYELPYEKEQVARFSPWSASIVELRTVLDRTILRKLYENGILLGDKSEGGWRLDYATEFHMTNDSNLFPPINTWVSAGFKQDEYGHWIKGEWNRIDGSDVEQSILERVLGTYISMDGHFKIMIDEISEVALPLYEGRMIDHFDHCAKGWVSGKGRSAKWRDIEWSAKVVEPQYLMSSEVYRLASKSRHGVKIAFMPIGSSTNSRTFVCTLLEEVPVAHSISLLLSMDGKIEDQLFGVGVMNSLVYDYQLRTRLGGLNISEFVVAETTLPKRLLDKQLETAIVKTAALLALYSTDRAKIWNQIDVPYTIPWQKCQILTTHERLRLSCINEALVAYAYRMTIDEFLHIIKDCDYPVSVVSSDDFARALDPKGFWRCDKDKNPELRLPILSYVAYHDLLNLGLDTFLTQNSDEGWQIPDSLKLANYNLGKDDRAMQFQPVAPLLGPRFFDWQLQVDTAQSWEECQKHASNIELIRSLRYDSLGEVTQLGPSEPIAVYDAKPSEPNQDLFGNEVKKKKKR